MEKEIIISKRFRNNTLRVFQYILKEFSAKTADDFLSNLEERIIFIANNPEIGKASVKKDVRSILFTPHNRIYYRYRNNAVEILCLFDLRKEPKKRPY